MMFLLTCDKKLTKSQLSPTHASTKRKITDELKHNAGWYEVHEGSPVEVQLWQFYRLWVLNCHTESTSESFQMIRTVARFLNDFLYCFVISTKCRQQHGAAVSRDERGSVQKKSVACSGYRADSRRAILILRRLRNTLQGLLAENKRSASQPISCN